MPTTESMSLRDMLFWFFITLFGTGTYVIYGAQSTTGEVLGISMMVVGFAGMVTCAWPHLRDAITGNPERARQWLRRITNFWSIAATATVAVLIIVGIHFYRFSPKMVPPPALQLTIPPSIPISFRLGCEIDHIPIHIPAASTIHVLRLHPSVLYGNPRFQDLGVFENITSPSDKPMDWPNKLNGRWMTKKETLASWSSGVPSTPYASKCTLTSYSPAEVTIDEIVAYLLIDIPDTTKPKTPTATNKRLSFPIAFDPLMSGHSFDFYVVNTCSSGVIPVLVQWGDRAKISVLGEQNSRIVPVRYEKLNFPSQLLMGSMGGTSFIWNDLHNCQWDHPN